MCLMVSLVEKLEKKSIKREHKSFGLPEQETDTESLVSLVYNKVL